MDLREKIAKIVYDCLGFVPILSAEKIADQILALIREAGYEPPEMVKEMVEKSYADGSELKEKMLHIIQTKISYEAVEDILTLIRQAEWEPPESVREMVEKSYQDGVDDTEQHFKGWKSPEEVEEITIKQVERFGKWLAVCLWE